MSQTTLRHVVAWRDVEERPIVAHTRVWGPVCSNAAAAAGCIRAAVSVVITPHISRHVVTAALGCVPADVLPRADDDAASLVARLSVSPFLDDAHVLNGGNGKRGAKGKKRRRLNESHYRAPRRKSWSVVVHAARADEDGEWVVGLLNYSAYGRLAEDVRSTPMPPPVFALGVQLWLAAMPYLCEESQRTPPSHCQLLLYYVQLRSRMGRHRDNYTVRHLRAMLAEGDGDAGSTHASMENSQRLGSEVLLYTEGSAPMDFTLSFPPANALDTGIKSYVKRAAFTARLGRGTLMIFKDLDDQFFCHEAEFSDAVRLADPTGYRLCYVFRWCTSVKNFLCAPAHNFKSSVPPPHNVVRL